MSAPTPAPRTASREPAPACEAERRKALIDGNPARAAFAECLLDSGDRQRAASVVANYLPERNDLRLRAELQSGDTGDHIDETTLNALIAHTPDDPWIWVALGREYERQGRDAEAVDAFLMAKTIEADRR